PATEPASEPAATAHDKFRELIAGVSTDAERQRAELARVAAEAERRFDQSIGESTRDAIARIRSEIAAVGSQTEKRLRAEAERNRLAAAERAQLTAAERDRIAEEDTAKSESARERARKEAEEKSRALESQLKRIRESRGEAIERLRAQIQEAERRAEAAERRAAANERIADLKTEEAAREYHLREVAAKASPAHDNGEPAAAGPRSPYLPAGDNGDRVPGLRESRKPHSQAPDAA
ncbi:MAG: hypothetical protein ACRDKV_00445, partial [Solirubrobacterales bacterium]